ncbi:MAG: hypothetical protein EXR71_08690 [Myxococcales bacterium]|nr:hypothetical protein [Myxococcales bacterium]
MRSKLVVAAVLLVVAVAGLLLTRAPASPTEESDCALVLASGKRKDCMVKVALATFAKDSRLGVEFTEARIEDPLQRDFVYLEAVRASCVAATDTLCKKIEDKTFRGQCDTVTKRPHLKKQGCR